MSMEIRLGHGGNYPTVRCEVCKRPIATASEGLVLFRANGGEVYFVHRGACDKAQCLRANEHLNWMRLVQYLHLLSHNVKVDHEKERQRWEEWHGVQE